MKKLLTLLLLLPLFGIGQKNDSLPYYKLIYDSASAGSYVGSGTVLYYTDIVKPVYDTVPVLIQYSDTAKIMKLGWEYFKVDTAASRKYSDTTTDKYFGFVGKWTRDTTWKEPNPNVYWMKGYELVERRYTPRISDGWHFHPEPEYLDEKRKPLSNNIVVWMSKRISD